MISNITQKEREKSPPSGQNKVITNKLHECQLKTDGQNVQNYK